MELVMATHARRVRELSEKHETACPRRVSDLDKESREEIETRNSGQHLFIAKEFAEAQRGTLTVTSGGHGKGAIFRLTLKTAAIE
jgi:light-regulated signal transduction histidine kinase (bacteriophytochrome)